MENCAVCDYEAITTRSISVDNRPKEVLPVCEIHADAADEDIAGGEVQEAIKKLQPLAERWERTAVWHNPPFLRGRIYVTTGDLQAISIVLKHLSKYV